MKRFYEILFYVTVGSGLAMATASFIIISGLFRDAGLGTVLLASLLGGAACLLVSGSVAELASAFPGTPGIKTYIKAAFGQDLSLACVFLYLLMIVMVAGVECFVFAKVVSQVTTVIPPMAVGLGVLAVVILMNLAGFEFSRNAQILSTLILLLSLAVMGIYGMAAGGLSRLAGSGLYRFEWDKLPSLIGLAIFLYVGFEWVTTIGYNRQAYRRKIPFSMGVSVIANVVVYSGFILGMAGVLAPAEIAATETPQVPFNKSLFGAIGGLWALGMSTLAIFSTFNAGLMGSARLLYAVARESALPGFCLRISSKGDPTGATLVLGAAGLVFAVLVFLFRLQMVAAILASAIVCAVYALLILSLWKLRRDGKIPAGGHRTVMGSKALIAASACMAALSAASLFSVMEFSLAACLAFVVSVTACLSAGRLVSVAKG